jgi:hypothetical protein
MERMTHRTGSDSAALEGECKRDEGDQAKKRPRRPLRGHYKPLYIPRLDAFEMIGCGPTKGHELINQGVLKTVRIGGRRYVTFESLERLGTPDDDSADAA